MMLPCLLDLTVRNSRPRPGAGFRSASSGWSKLLPAGPVRGEAFVGAVDDEFAEELGQGGEHMEHQAPAGSGGVEGFLQGPEPDATAPQIGHDHDQVLRGAAEPVQGGDYEGAAGARQSRMLQHPIPRLLAMPAATRIHDHQAVEDVTVGVREALVAESGRDACHPQQGGAEMGLRVAETDPLA